MARVCGGQARPSRARVRGNLPPAGKFSPPPSLSGSSPYRGLCLGRGAVPQLGAELERQLFEDTVAYGLAARLDPNLGRDHRNDADDLRLRCKPIWIEAIGGPGKHSIGSSRAACVHP
jgi:hypothetical protein